MPTYIGIDPGLRSGAWGVIDHHGGFIACGDIPQDGDRVDAKALRASLQAAIPKGDVAEFCVEIVGAMPGQGIVSTGRFLRAAGCIEAVCTLMNYPVAYATPKEWKHHWGLSANKDESVVLARRLFPEARDHLKRVKDHGRAEALLIAGYWRDQFGYENAIGECGK